MAKMTINNVTYEGTPEELWEIVKSFEEAAEPGEHTTVNRKAEVGERIKITSKADRAMRDMTVGNIYKVVAEGIPGNYVNIIDDEGDEASASDGYYEVILEETTDKPAREVYPETGDIIRAIRGIYDIKAGELGVVVAGDGTDRPLVKIPGKSALFLYSELVARAEDRVDTL